MTTFTQPISVPFNPVASYTGEYDEKIDFIEIEDIKDIAIDSHSSKAPSFFSTLGITPTPIVIDNVAATTALSLFIATIVSIWVSNIVIIFIFLGLALVTFITGLFVEEKPFRDKIASLLTDLFIVGIMGTITQYLFQNVTTPFINVPIPIFTGLLWLMIINYLILNSKRLYPTSSLTKSKLLTAFLLSARDGIDVFKSKLQERIEDDISGRERRPN